MTVFKVTYSKSDVTTSNVKADSATDATEAFKKNYPTLKVIDVKPYKIYKVRFNDVIHYEADIVSTSSDKEELMRIIGGMDFDFLEDGNRDLEICNVEEIGTVEDEEDYDLDANKED